MKPSHRPRWFDLCSLLIRVAGLVALLSIPFKHVAHSSHLVSFGLGIGLFYVASQVNLRKRNAWYLAVGALAVLAAVELWHYHGPLQLSLYVIALAVLLLRRRQFVVRSDTTSLRRAAKVTATLLAVLLLFILTVFTVLDQRAFGRQVTTAKTFTVSLQQLTGQDLPPEVRLRRYDYALLDLLRLAGAAMALVILVALFRPLQLHRTGSAGQLKRARQLLGQYSDSPEDYFKLWPADKHYYFYDESFVAYGLANGVALVLDGVAGRPEDLVQLRRSFVEYSRLNGWQVAVIHADETEAEAWQDAMGQVLGGSEGKRLFIGSEAFVGVGQFIQKTSRSKHFRYVRNRAAKDGLSFELWQPPLNSSQLAELERVSQAWLSDGGRREYSFMMGYFDEAYLRECQVALLFKDGEAVAYTNVIPTFTPGRVSIDHIRLLPAISPVAMHFLLLNTIQHVAEQQATEFNLGLAPLSKLDEQTDKNLNERLLAVIKRFGGRYYSFAGLEQFKGKFVPDWSPRYIVYQQGSLLLRVAMALGAVSAYEPLHQQRDRWRRWLLLAAVVAGLCYAAFPLAMVLNPPYAWHGLVSFLGKDGQPYSNLFNSLDIVSAGLTLLVGLCIIWRYALPGYRLYWLAALVAVGGLGDLVAAVVNLPPAFNDVSLQAVFRSLNWHVAVHGAASFINSGAFVAAAALWVWPVHGEADKRVWWRWLLAGLIVGLSTLGFVAGVIWPATSPFIQRLFIVSYAVWLVAAVIDLTRSPQRQPAKISKTI